MMRTYRMRCIRYAVITRDFCLRGSGRGWDSRRCCRRKEGEKEGVSLMKFLIIPPPLAQGRITECHLGQCSLWNYIYEIHLSPSFLPLFPSLPLCIPPVLPSLSSNWRCNKGVWGQWFFKVRPRCVCLILMFSSRRSSSCRPNLAFSASLTKTTGLKPPSCFSNNLAHATRLFCANFPSVIYGSISLQRHASCPPLSTLLRVLVPAC